MYAIIIPNAANTGGTILNTAATAASAYALLDKYQAGLNDSPVDAIVAADAALESLLKVVNTVALVNPGDVLTATGALYVAVNRPA